MRKTGLKFAWFESLVNSEGSKTHARTTRAYQSLRALLIQKEAKQLCLIPESLIGLRALLIQKEAKLKPMVQDH